MEPYSPYIKKYLKKIEEAGYSINPNGSQLHKSIANYEVIITDLTVKSLFMIKTVLVWIKNTDTKVIEKEQFFRHEILPLPFFKIDNFAKTVIADLNESWGELEESSDAFVANDLVHSVNVGDVATY
ncbi:MAG: hypothetical protein ACK5M3_05915 [Dysgonomonas sp.]